MKNTKGSKRIIALLIMISLVLTSGTFAYWASFVEGTSNDATGTLTVGSGNSVATRFDLTNELNSGGLLVPVGQLVNSNEGVVEAIDLSFDVQWVENEEVTQMLGVGAVGQINVQDEVVIVLDGVVLNRELYSNIYALIHVSYNEANATELTLDAEAVTFGFQITMDEPADQAEYNLIANAEVSVTFTYTITANNIVATDVE